MKNTNLKMILAAAALLLGGRAMASDFDLASMNADDIRAVQADMKAAPAVQPVADDLVGIDLAVRVPFKTLKKAVGMVAASDKRISIINPDAAVALKSGEFLRLTNIRVNQGGIIVQPTLILKPYLEATDKLAIRIQRVQFHAEMQPDVKAAPAMTAMNQEEVMGQVMDTMIKGVYAAVNDFLKKKQVPMRAEEVIKMSYSKADWTLRAQVSSKILNQFVPPGLVGELHLTGFAVTDTGITLKIQTPQ